MDDSSVDRVRKTAQDSGTVIELEQDELEHVVGGLQRTWIKPPSSSHEATTVDSGGDATPVGRALAK